jgi:hypothetical protein
MMKKIIYFLLTGFYIAGCTVNEREHTLENVQSQDKDQPVFVQEIIYTKDSKYAKFFDSNVDNEVAYGSSREHPLHFRDFNAHAKKIKIENKGEIMQTSTTANKLSVFINGESIEQLNSNNIVSNSQNTVQQAAALDRQLYGQDVLFTLQEERIIENRPTIVEKTVTMYVPQIAEITYPKSHQSLYPICYFDRYRLKWNKDEKNTIGMIIIVEWDGSLLEGEITDSYVRKIDIVEDTGETIIKREMFDEIPHFAIVRVTIIRGNIDITEFNESVYKLYAESNASLHTIILKEDI